MRITEQWCGILNCLKNPSKNSVLIDTKKALFRDFFRKKFRQSIYRESMDLWTWRIREFDKYVNLFRNCNFTTIFFKKKNLSNNYMVLKCQNLKKKIMIFIGKMILFFLNFMQNFGSGMIQLVVILVNI